MSIWGMPSVADQPTVTMIRWRILRIKAKKTSIDLVLGWCIEDGHARMSTPIVNHDANARTLTTKSGRVYVVQGAPDYDDDAQYIAEQHFGPAVGRAKNVSAEYFIDFLPAKRKKSTFPKRIVNVHLSDAESSNLINSSDAVFEPNKKLAKALKKVK